MICSIFSPYYKRETTTLNPYANNRSFVEINGWPTTGEDTNITGRKFVPLSYLVFGVLTPVTHSMKHKAFVFSTSFSPLLHVVKTAFGISYSSVPAALLYKSVNCEICTSPQFYYFAVRKVVSPAGRMQCIFPETNVSRLFLCTQFINIQMMLNHHVSNKFAFFTVRISHL